MSQNRWVEIALSASVVRRAIKVSGVVGTLLVAINHGPALLAGEVSGARLFQIGLTYVVPYCVATWSAVSALIEKDRLIEHPSNPVDGSPSEPRRRG